MGSRRLLCVRCTFSHVRLVGRHAVGCVIGSMCLTRPTGTKQNPGLIAGGGGANIESIASEYSVFQAFLRVLALPPLTELR